MCEEMRRASYLTPPPHSTRLAMGSHRLRPLTSTRERYDVSVRETYIRVLTCVGDGSDFVHSYRGWHHRNYPVPTKCQPCKCHRPSQPPSPPPSPPLPGPLATPWTLRGISLLRVLASIT